MGVSLCVEDSEGLEEDIHTHTHTHTHTHRNGVGGKKTHTHTPGISADFGPALVVFPLFHLPVIVPLPG